MHPQACGDAEAGLRGSQSWLVGHGRAGQHTVWMLPGEAYALLRELRPPPLTDSGGETTQSSQQRKGRDCLGGERCSCSSPP